MQKILPSEFRFVELTQEEFQVIWNEHGFKLFNDESINLDTRKILSDEEKRFCKELSKNMSNLIHLNIAIYKADQLCGWFSGNQQSYEHFYMRNSAILPQFRRQGLYTALLNEVISRVSLLGFQIIESRHKTTNNSIIIPKLKAGFVITAIEVSDRFGTLVHLNYFFNSTRRKAIEFRAGDLKPDAQLKDALGIT